ncbi:unnamed protein product [Closterium sp. NIES-54]
MGKVGDSSVFRVWGALSFVRDAKASKLSSRTLRCVFLGFPTDAPPWQFYHPHSRRVFSFQDVTFDESVCYYRLHPHASHPVPLAPLFSVRVPLPVDPLPPQGPAPSGVSQVDPPPLVEPLEISSDSSGPAEGGDPTGDDTTATRRSPRLETPPDFLPRPSSPPLQPAAVDSGAETAGAEPGGAETEGAGSGGAATGGAATGGAATGGAASGGAGSGGAATAVAGSWGAATGGAYSGGLASPSGGGAVGDPAGGPGVGQPPQPDLLETLSPQEIRTAGTEGTAGGAGGAIGASAAGAGGPGATSPKGATGARGAGATSPGGTAGAGGAGGAAGAGGAGAGGAGAAGAAGPKSARTGGAGATGAGGVVRAGGATGAAGAGDTAGAGGATGAAGTGGAGGTAGAGGARAGGTGGTGAAGAAGPGGAHTSGARAAGAGGAAGARGAGGATGAIGTGGAGGTTSARGPGTAGARGAAGAADQSPPLLLPSSSLPAPAPHTEVTESLTERREPETRASSPVRARRIARPRPLAVPGTHGVAIRPSSVSQRVVLPEPPASSLPHVTVPGTDLARATSPTGTRLLATVITDPDLESTATFSLVTELVNFAARSRIAYVASLVSESESVCPLSLGGEAALGSDVLEDSQFELECLAAALPRFASMLLCLEGDPDALDIPTPRSYVEAIAGSPPAFKVRYVARCFSERQGVDFFQTFSPTLKMTILRVLLHGAAQRDYELHSLDFSTAFLQGSLHEEILLHHPPGFTGNTLAALISAPSFADPSLFLRTDTTLPPFYVLVYVDDLVFATAYTEALALVLQRFGFYFSSPQPTPPSTSHSLSAPPSDESVEPSGPYPELVGCLMYLVMCTRPDLAYPLSLLACYVAPGRHRKVHWDAATRVLRYLCKVEIYAGAMAAQELHWLTYLLNNLGGRPRSLQVLVLTFDAEGRAIDFEVWVDDLQLFLQCDRADGLSLFDLTSGASPAPPDTAHSTVRSQWATRDAAARLAVRRHLPTTERAHFSQNKSAQTLYDAVVARYSSPATAALSCLFLPYLFPDLAAFPTVADLITHLRTSDTRYRAALPAEFCAKNPPPIYLTLYYVVTRLPDSLCVVRDHFLSVCPTTLTVDLLEERLLAAEQSIVAVGASRGDPRTPIFVGCSPSPLLPSVASAAAADLGGFEGRSLESPQSLDYCGAQVVSRLRRDPPNLRGVAPVVVSASSSSAVVRPPPPSSFVSGTLGVSEVEFPDATEIPRWGDLSRAGVAIFDLDYDAILAAMYALSTSDEGDCYLCVPPDPGIEAAALGAGETAALGASASAAPGAGESAPAGTASAQTLLWHHRLGHPSLPRLRGMASRVLVSGLPRSLPPLPPGPAPTCVPCVEGRQRAAPHSSEFPPTEAPLQTLHMDVWGPARVRGQGHERYFLLVVDDYSRYTSVFPLHSKGEVTEVLIDWIRAARLRLRESFGSDFPVLRLHSDRGGEFSSALLGAFCRAQGIRQTFTLPASPQQNGIVERRIGMVMDVARTSMIHAAAPHFLWPFAVQYAAHQLNLQPRVSLPETSPTLLWMGKVGDASAFRVWGSRAFVRDLSADKLSPRVVPCVFLGFPPDAPGWQFYHPTSRRVLSSQDVTFDESVPYYRLFPYRTAPLPPPPLFLAPGPPPVDPLPPQGPAPSGVSQVDAVEPVEVAVDSGAATGAEPAGAGSGGAESGGAETRGAEPGGAEPGGAEPGGAETRGTEPGGAETGGAEPGGAEPGGTEPGGAEPGVTGSARVASRGASSRREVLSPQELREWFAQRSGRAAGAGGTTAAAGPSGTAEAAGVGPTGGCAGASGGTGAAGSAGTGAAGAFGVGAAGGVGAGYSADAGTSEGAGAGAARAGGATGAGAPAGSPGVVPAGSGGTTRPRPYFVPLLEQVLGLPPSPCPAPPFEFPQPVQSQSLLQPISPLPAPSPYTGPTGGLAESRAPTSRPAPPARLACTSRRTSRPRPPAVSGTHQMALRSSTAPLRVPLPSPPASSLRVLADPESDSLRAASPTVARFLATIVTDPSLASTAASALVAELVDFAARCRLDYAASLVAESATVCPPSVGGECALSTDVIEDRQEEFQCFAAALPHLVSTLLAPEGDPDAPDIPTPRSYAEAIEGPYSSQWQAAMDAEMASWKSTGTYVDEVPPPGANIGVDYFQTFSPTPKMTTLRVLLHVAAQRDYELHSLDFSTAFLQGSLHEEIWLRRPPGFTGSFPPGTQWSLRRPVYGLRQAPREWHDTLRTTLAASADPSLFLRTDTSLPLFYILVYVDDLVFATVDTAGLAHVKSELQKRHMCTDLGELRSYLGLQITPDRAERTITLTQSHMVQQVLQRFDFTYSSPQATPLSTRHSLSARPSDESVEPSGPYPELVGCLMYLMTCTQPYLAYDARSCAYLASLAYFLILSVL